MFSLILSCPSVAPCRDGEYILESDVLVEGQCILLAGLTSSALNLNMTSISNNDMVSTMI
jgi:hypothetical protein